jgi:hypothetical protein
MPNDSDWPPPLTILAFAFGAAAVLAVLGAVLYYVIPVIGTAIGLCVAVSTAGLTAVGSIAAWAVPVASFGVATLGATAAAAGVKAIADSAQEKPYEWGLPLLGAFAGFASTLAKDTGLEANVSKWLFGGITALLIVVAGACYKRRGFLWKGIAVLLYLLPPLVLLGWSTLSTKQSTLAGAFGSVSSWTWLGLSCIVVIGIIIGVLAHLDAARNRTATV